MSRDWIRLYFWTSIFYNSFKNVQFWTSMFISASPRAYDLTSMSISISGGRTEHHWTSRTIFLLKKSTYGPQNWVGNLKIPKKTRAEKWCVLAVFARRDPSYESDSRPKTKTVSRAVSGVLCIGIRHRSINPFWVINIDLLYNAFLWSKLFNLR